MEVIKATDADITDLLNAHEQVVVKYYADWCGSCKLFAPKFKRMARDGQFEGVTFIDVNAEENPSARALAGVTNLPFFAIFKNGQLVETLNASKEEAVAALINKLNNN